MESTNRDPITRVDFEIFGKVQRVNFRKYTQSKAKSLNLRGWVKNTSAGTVVGSMEGRSRDVDCMMEWLRTTGSPKSEIVKADFKNAKKLDKHSFSSTAFIIKK
ncbi:acylphosphatase-1-like isoform X1 [Diaphorina citri]|uniref:acylphosphatase n=1 Tax=Diaphorina citri TaxID=121845 RepID=A0A1S3D9A0_DIACI|nr:acylphosphatase-1-like isoform X1 [Diaphorina citri]